MSTYRSSSSGMTMRRLAEAASEGRGHPNRSNFHIHHLDTVIYGVGIKSGTDKVSGRAFLC